VAGQPNEDSEGKPTQRRAARQNNQGQSPRAHNGHEPEKSVRKRREAVAEHPNGSNNSARSSPTTSGALGSAHPAGDPARDALTEAAARKAARETARKVAPDAAREAAREVAREVVPQVVREASREAARVAGAAARQAAQSVAPEVAREVARQIAREVAREEAPRFVDEAVQRLAPEVARQIAAKGTRAARHESASQQPWWRRAARTIISPVRPGIGILVAGVVLPVICALIASVVAVQTDSGARVAAAIFNRGDPPVDFLSILERDYGAQGETWALPNKVGSLTLNDDTLLKTASANPDEFQKWVRERGGVDVGISFIRLVVTSRQAGKIEVTDMHAEIEHPDKPLNGALFYAPPQGDATNSVIGFNLDEPGGVAREVNTEETFRDKQDLGEPYFRAHSVTLTYGEQHIFNVVALTTEHYYSWYIRVSIYVNNKLQEFKVGLPGTSPGQQRPFQITARADRLTTKEKGNFSVYKELYVWDGQSPGGFDKLDPNTYTE
jgi:hypothetical protein